MMGLPDGTITLLFTDIEGSTRLWEQYPEAMRTALADHDGLMREAIAHCNGHVFKTIGDAFCASFTSPVDALNAALAAQRRLPSLQDHFPAGVALRVRMALHTGAPELRDNDYFGQPLNRVARLLAVGHGGQVLLSQVTASMLQEGLSRDVALIDLGTHRLRDLQRPEQIFQVSHSDLLADFAPLRSLDYVPTNLPQAVTSFIGRENEIAEIRHLMADHRLVTLTGPGGCGKTRLALHVGAEFIDEHTDGVWQIELAAISAPELVPQAVCTALGIREEAGTAALETLEQFLRDRRLLLLLDNCEHLLAACASLCDRLLRRCNGVKILATSTENLHIQGEQVYSVPSLSLPKFSERLTILAPALAMDSEAVRLFVERTALALPSFTLTPQSALAIARICLRLDGIPLAIELAAARMRALPADQIQARLDDRFRLLTGGNRAALPRQQTLRALVDWSYDLLNPLERTLLRRLAVFSGGWTLDAAEQVCSDPNDAGADRSDPVIQTWEVLDLLVSLVEKSLVVYEPGREEPRYRLLETIRQYALEKLEHDEPDAPVRKAHLAYCLALAAEANANLAGPEQGRWLERLDVEHDNLRTALAYSLAAKQGAAHLIGEERSSPAGDRVENVAPEIVGLRIAGLLFRFWYIRGYWTEGRRQIDAFIGHLKSWPGVRETVDWANALNGAGALAWAQGDLDEGVNWFTASLDVWRACGDLQGEAKALGNLGVIAISRKDFEAGRSLQEQSLLIRRKLGDRDGIGKALINLGTVANEQGDYPAARGYFQDALDIYRESEDLNSVATCLNSLAVIVGKLGEYAAAHAMLDVAEQNYRQLGSRGSLAEVIHSRAEIAYLSGDNELAVAAIEESLDIYRELGEGLNLMGSLALRGKVALKQKDYAQAIRSYSECAGMCLERADPGRMIFHLEELSILAFAQGQEEVFLRLSAQIDRLRERYSIARSPDEEGDVLNRRRQALARVSDPQRFDVDGRGRALPSDFVPAALLEAVLAPLT